jgi:hypothetical protein
MGDFFLTADARNVARSLNWLFDENLNDTYTTINRIRAVYPTFLNPDGDPDPRAYRRQTLRFAAFHLADGVPFTGTKYPAKKFRKFLRWLTWLAGQGGGTLTENNAPYAGSGPFDATAAGLILKTMHDALPYPAGTPKKIKFKWDPGPLSVTVTTAADRNRIVVTSMKEEDVIGGPQPDDDDDV